MCGLLTIIGKDPGDDAVIRMRETMHHRGPDGHGYWRATNIVMAHRRLAVIDTSDQGLQPMHSADGKHALVYNGELYNDSQLREAISNSPGRFRPGARATWPSATNPRRRLFRRRSAIARPCCTARKGSSM